MAALRVRTLVASPIAANPPKINVATAAGFPPIANMAPTRSAVGTVQANSLSASSRTRSRRVIKSLSVTTAR